MYAKSTYVYSSIFFIPDYTVGTGFTPVQPCSKNRSQFVDYTTGRDFHPAPEDESFLNLYIVYLNFHKLQVFSSNWCYFFTVAQPYVQVVLLHAVLRNAILQIVNHLQIRIQIFHALIFLLDVQYFQTYS